MKQKETAIEDYVLPKFDVDCHMPRFDCDVIYVSIVKTMFVFDKSCYEGKFQLSFKFNSLTLHYVHNTVYPCRVVGFGHPGKWHILVFFVTCYVYYYCCL